MPRDTEITEDIEGNGANGVHVALDTTSMPYRVATFDGREKVSEWTAALQREEEIIFAKGYLAAKKEYETDIEDLGLSPVAKGTIEVLKEEYDHDQDYEYRRSDDE